MGIWKILRKHLLLVQVLLLHGSCSPTTYTFNEIFAGSSSQEMIECESHHDNNKKLSQSELKMTEFLTKHINAPFECINLSFISHCLIYHRFYKVQRGLTFLNSIVKDFPLDWCIPMTILVRNWQRFMHPHSFNFLLVFSLQYSGLNIQLLIPSFSFEMFDFFDIWGWNVHDDFTSAPHIANCFCCLNWKLQVPVGGQ